MRPRTGTRHHIDWINPYGGTVRLRITHQRDYLATGDDHLAIESIEPAKAPLPITDTGYLSHFVRGDVLKEAGGRKRYGAEWLAREGWSKEWQKRDAARRQGDLFKWAEAQAELAKPVSAPKRVQARQGALQRLTPKPKGRGAG